MDIQTYRKYKFVRVDKNGNEAIHTGEVQFEVNNPTGEKTYLIKLDNGYRYLVPKQNILHRAI